MKTYKLLIPVILGVALAVVYASVFVYNPVTLSLSPVSNPIQLLAGTNAGSHDLVSGNTITVTPGNNQSSLSITIHPTYQYTDYENIAIIKNTDSQSYNVWISVNNPISGLPSGSHVYLIVNGTIKGDLLTLSSSSPLNLGTLSGGNEYVIGLHVYIPEGSTLPSSASGSLYIIYSPSPETPNSTP
ncbi:hypothetical protein [Fervidicoccus fontis]|uniref:DUF1102 domain-containing protein n=1 Tax=Fervidicoccus fontis (strain DSM 19380 / JCM 18336 / VKM B-2539 / Kam940) TaxID=1163730 RepID=I0A052_FERFK|nr:hypothetical protein [Fervidicoccus fontis]AFH42359.1 hypothetical protein FFONT_0369 [Fervidicoccus fontis Kam940]